MDLSQVALFDHRELAADAHAILTQLEQTPPFRDESRRRAHSLSDYKIAFQNFEQLDPGKSLLINNCDRWCADSEFKLEQIIGAAAYKSWRDNLNSTVFQLSHNELFANAPFQLLAVVNRMDLAQWKDPRWHDAELRFVYGLAATGADGNPVNLTAILEVVLPPLSWKEFQQLGNDWADFSIKNISQTNLGQQLKNVILPKYLYPNTRNRRIRVNTSLGNGSSWDLYQWDWDGQSQFVRAALTDEISKTVVFDVAPNPIYRAAWNKLDKNPFVAGYPIDKRIIEKNSRRYSIAPDTSGIMPLPSWRCESQPADNDRDRRILSTQQCSYCHSTETGTSGGHIFNRKTGETVARLSTFLQPIVASPGAKLTASSSTDLIMQITPVTYTFNACGQSTTINRYYYDLYRRAQFLSTVLSWRPRPTQEEQTRLAALALVFGPIYVH